MSRDVLAISRLFSSHVYIRRRDFLSIESVIQREIVKCSKKALFCGDCCDRSQAIILVVLVLISLIFIQQSALVSVFNKGTNSKF